MCTTRCIFSGNDAEKCGEQQGCQWVDGVCKTDYSQVSAQDQCRGNTDCAWANGKCITACESISVAMGEGKCIADSR